MWMYADSFVKESTSESKRRADRFLVCVNNAFRRGLHLPRYQPAELAGHARICRYITKRADLSTNIG